MIGTAASVAARLAYAREGSRLVGYKALALPVYHLRLEAVIQRRKPIPAIEEFVLRAVDQGIDEPDEIADLLGLDGRLTERALVSQLGAGHLTYGTTGSGGRRLRLSPRGETALVELVAIEPERTEVNVTFDRLKWAVTGAAEKGLYRPREVSADSAKPRFTRTPRLDEVEVDDVSSAIALALGRRDGRFADDAELEVVGIGAIAGTMALYRPSTVLAFKPSDGVQCDGVIAIEGRIDLDYTGIVSDASNRTELGVDNVEAQREASIRAATNDIDRTLGKLLVPRSKVDDIRSRIISKESLLGASLGDVDPSASEALRDEIAASRRELDSLPVRHVEPWEHAHILQRAIETARERLLIVADLAGQRTVGQEFLDGIERACNRGVTCHIGFARELEGPASPQPWAALTRLAERLRSGLRVHRFDGKHPGTLIADGTWVSSEFPWLSHLDDMGLRAELGLAVTVPAAVDQAYTTAAALAEGRQA